MDRVRYVRTTNETQHTRTDRWTCNYTPRLSRSTGRAGHKQGEVVNATFGFTSILIKALTDIKPEYIAVTFDRPAPTFRHENYAEYKVHRPTLPEIMRPQFSRVREVVEAFDIPFYEKDGLETDEVLGTLSVQATQQGVDTIIFTGDMDTLQLVNEHVHALVAK